MEREAARRLLKRWPAVSGTELQWTWPAPLAAGSTVAGSASGFGCPPLPRRVPEPQPRAAVCGLRLRQRIQSALVFRRRMLLCAPLGLYGSPPRGLARERKPLARKLFGQPSP